MSPKRTTRPSARWNSLRVRMTSALVTWPCLTLLAALDGAADPPGPEVLMGRASLMVTLMIRPIPATWSGFPSIPMHMATFPPVLSATASRVMRNIMRAAGLDWGVRGVMEYRGLGSLRGRVLLAEEPAAVGGALKKKAFKKPEDICLYDFALEESVLKQQPAPQHTAPTATSVNDDILRSLNELKDEIESASNASTRRDSVLGASAQAAPRAPPQGNPRSLRLRAEAAAEEHLRADGNLDAALMLRFIDFYCALQEHYALPTTDKLEDPECLLDDEVGKCFDLDMTDPPRAMAFISIRREMRDLGFDDAKVISALLMFNNNRDLCIEYLMRE